MDVEKIKRFFQVNRKLVVAGGLYHVTQHAPGREKLFVEDEDYLFFLSLLKKNTFQFKTKIFSFALLPNHLHILLKTKKANLPESMKSLFQSYAMAFNEKYKRKGHVFCGRYRAAFCNDESYFLTISLYIHLNPFKAGLCNDPESYRWYSLEPYIKDVSWQFLDSQFILSMLDEDPKRARQIYRNLLSQGIDFDFPNIIEKPSSIEKFSRNVIRSLRSFTKKIRNTDLRERASLEDTIDRLAGRKKLSAPQDIEARRYVVEQLFARGYKIAEICQILKISRFTLFRMQQNRS